MLTFKDKLAEAFYCMNETNEHIFLTGDAGTGKTTLLREFISKTSKNCVVLAPTGVAALNAGGQTIHSFFGFRAGAISYESIKNLKTDPVKYRLHQAVDTIIIDEASMIRADLMDLIGNFYKKNFPGTIFGGKQIILIGDLDQLPPIVTDEDRAYIDSKYANEFFISANVWKVAKYRTIKLDKVFRQNDPIFVGLLNRIKNNNIHENDIEFINSQCYKPGHKMTPENNGMVLTSTNSIAANINLIQLSRIEGESFRFEAIVTGDVKATQAPVDPIIEVKKGARVMICINDQGDNRRFVNGTLGELVEIEPYKKIEDEILGTIESGPTLHIKPDGTDMILKMNMFLFEKVKYVLNESTGKLVKTVVGSIRQFPIKLAYAQTIHKSQGSTFDKIIIDLGRGAFAHGQVYVALSRCRTLEGITLRTPMKESDLVYNENILKFNKSLIQ